MSFRTHAITPLLQLRFFGLSFLALPWCIGETLNNNLNQAHDRISNEEKADVAAHLGEGLWMTGKKRREKYFSLSTRSSLRSPPIN